ncbi:30S ribosomal protein S2 [bacterium]|nr:30S ribosomal protein S2 [bacterium]MBU1637983.1 30S ribosomal protein S2 [bacterium]MBU1920909.1 30S ribosomal protein S2 [bacterium]
MSRVTLQQLLLAGAHFGHLTRRWHPKMKPYILMQKNGIHLIDLRQTQDCLTQACDGLSKVAANGQQILFVGTKNQAREVIQAEAKRADSPYVTERWLGGMLTNFQTIRQGVKTLESFEKMMTDGTFEKISKKERLTIERRHAKLLQSLGGIRHMRHLPGAVFVVDIKREKIAIAEAKRLKIPVVAMVDTNVNPEEIDLPIPANDDAFKSIALIGRAISESIIEGTAIYKSKVHVQEDTAQTEARDREAGEETAPGDRRRRRVRRPVKREEGGEKPQESQADTQVSE